MADTHDAEPRQRPRLQLKPRDPEAAKKLELERLHSGGKVNPFGEAKPREAVLSTRLGKSEEEILKEEIKSERPKLRLNPQQLEEKRAAEAAISEIQELVDGEPDPVKRSELKEELTARKTALDELMDGFEKLAVEAAARGEVMRPSERRQKAIEEGRPGYVPGALDRAGSGGIYGSGAIAGPGGYGGGGDGFRGGYGGRGGRGPGFSGYEDRGPGYGGGGYERRGGGGGGGYQEPPARREYRGPSDYHNAETFGPEAVSYRGGGGGGGGRRGGGGGGGGFGGGGGYRSGGRGGFENSSGRFDDDPRNYPGMGGPLPGSGRGDDDYYAMPGGVQDRY